MRDTWGLLPLGKGTPTGAGGRRQELSLAGGRMPACALDHAATRPRASGEGVPDDDRQDRADRGDHDGADVERAVDRVCAEQCAGEEAADQGADDAEHDVPDDAQALVTADEEAGKVAGDRAKHDPRDDAHRYLRPCEVSTLERACSA